MAWAIGFVRRGRGGGRERRRPRAGRGNVVFFSFSLFVFYILLPRSLGSPRRLGELASSFPRPPTLRFLPLFFLASRRLHEHGRPFSSNTKEREGENGC